MPVFVYGNTWLFARLCQQFLHVQLLIFTTAAVESFWQMLRQLHEGRQSLPSCGS